MMNIILASNSPRRKELLKLITPNFTVVPSDFDESSLKGISPEIQAEKLSLGKAQSVFSRCGGIVIGADTIVVLEGKILNKPKDEVDAFNMLKSLSGKTHEVITGYTVICENKIVTGHEKTLVTFNRLSDKTISNYVKTKSPLDKAGGYGIQDNDFLVKEIDGDYYNVVGFPVEAIKKILNENFFDAERI